MIPLRDNISSRKIPFVNYLLILANIAAFYYGLTLIGQGAVEKYIFTYAIVPKLITSDLSGNIYTLFTSQFLHGGWMHLIGNMLYLYIFGDNVEDKFGHFKYLVFYLLCGIGAAFTQIYFNPDSSIPMIGASGAIAGVLGAYFLFYPRSRILTLVPLVIFIRIVEIPSFLFLGFWFIMQTFSGTASLHTSRMIGQEVGGVAWWAHAGGFLSGSIFAILLKLKIV